MIHRKDLKIELSPAGLRQLRLVVIGAHPDDETIGAATRLQHAPLSTVVTITNGSPQNLADAKAAGFQSQGEYAQGRQIEQDRVLEMVGVSGPRIVRLGFVDQEAQKNLLPIIEKLSVLITSLKADLILTHPYEGGHPDHDTTALALHICRQLAQKKQQDFPILAEFTSYHMQAGRRQSGVFIERPWYEVTEFSLTPEERALKARMLAGYFSQRKILEGFTTDVERFRYAPTYEFSQAPHSGKLYYETFDWGIDARDWRDQAVKVLKQLKLDTDL